MNSKTRPIEVEVYLDEFSDDELISEMNLRNIGVNCEVRRLITEIWHMRRVVKNYDEAVDRLIYTALGKII